jgi:small-conductance mechanosensitive channel
MESQLIYFAVVSGVGLFLFFWLRWWLLHIEARRARRIEKLPRFEAIKTRLPEKIGGGQSRKQALQGLETRFSIFRRTLLSLILFLWGLALVFPFLGRVPGTLVSLSITAGAVIVGIAARPMVENFIAGFVLTFSKQFHTGDTILIDQQYGTIEDITPTHTVVKLWDWRRYIVPNSGMLSKEVFNFSTRDSYLWAKFEFYVAHDADLQLVESIAVQTASQHRLLVGNEQPQFWVMGMEKESIKCWLAMWTAAPADAWTINVEIRRDLTRKLNDAGIKPHAYHHRPFD